MAKKRIEVRLDERLLSRLDSGQVSSSRISDLLCDHHQLDRYTFRPLYEIEAEQLELKVKARANAKPKPARNLKLKPDPSWPDDEQIEHQEARGYTLGGDPVVPDLWAHYHATDNPLQPFRYSYWHPTIDGMDKWRHVDRAYRASADGQPLQSPSRPNLETNPSPHADLDINLEGLDNLDLP